LTVLLFNIIPYIQKRQLTFISFQSAKAQDFSSEVIHENDDDGNGEYCILETSMSGPSDPSNQYSPASTTVCDEEVDCDTGAVIGGAISINCVTTYQQGPTGPPGGDDLGDSDGDPTPTYTGQDAIPPPSGGINLPPQQNFNCTTVTSILNSTDANNLLDEMSQYEPYLDTSQGLIYSAIAPQWILGAGVTTATAARGITLGNVKTTFNNSNSPGMVVTLMVCTNTYGTGSYTSSTIYFSKSDGTSLGTVTF
jgi:hypothetical protein